MLFAARILAILLLTLGFQIHGFVGAVTAASASPCALTVTVDPDGAKGEAVPDKPSPSCKVIGAAGAGQPRPAVEARGAIPPVPAESGNAAVWPGGPEKPPKFG